MTHRRKTSARSAADLLPALAEQLAQLADVADVRSLKPGALIRLVNSTPLGQVLADRSLRKLRERAGRRIESAGGNGIDLLKFAAWLAGEHHRARRREAAATASPANAPAVPRQTIAPDDPYQRQKARSRAYQHDAAAAGMDIGELPPIADPERRARCLADPEAFCREYFPLRFKKAMSDDQRRSIAELARIAEHGGKKAFAAPRGDGKTTRSEIMVIWSILTGRRRFVALVGATAAAAKESMESIKGEFESNDLLLADFPEVCYPVHCLEGINQRAKGQTYRGERTLMKWAGDLVVLPTMPDSPASGAVFCCRGITGRIRGMKHRRADGATVRPDLAIVDDPQTEKSAHSQGQCKRRLATLTGAILGLAGPGESIACFVPCTVIAKDDLADQILDRDRHPAFQGVRTRLIHTFPTNEDLWEEYAELRRAGLKIDDLSKSNAFYKKHRKAMNAGAVVAWPERYDADAGELSAIQHAMNLRIDHPETFDAEYQNEPRDLAADDDRLPSAAEIGRKLSGLPRRKVPLAATILTAFIDVQQRLLYHAVSAWSPEFTGSVIDYGTWPDQQRAYFTYRDAPRTIQSLPQFKTAGVAGAIRGALDALIAELATRVYEREDGAELRINRILVDSGDWADIVYQACRESPHAALVLPSKGRGVTAAKAPISEWRRAEGQLVGEEWMLGKVANKRAVRLFTYDTNYWKTRTFQALATLPSDRGCLTLFGQPHKTSHDMLAAHCAAETRTKTFGLGRTVYAYDLRPEKPDNHLLDCLVGSAACASLLGCRLIGRPLVRRPKPPEPETPAVSPLKC